MFPKESLEQSSLECWRYRKLLPGTGEHRKETMQRFERILLNREVAFALIALVGFYALANTVIEPFGKPLEPIAEALYVGFWTFRHHFVVGDFLTQLVVTWLWFLAYSYVLAVAVAAVYKQVRERNLAV